MKRKRKLFCELSPLTYQISYTKCKFIRYIRDLFSGADFAAEKQQTPLPVVICSHKSLIRRRLGNVDMNLQENKAVNLSLAAPKVSGILIRPGQAFSFWRLVGPCTGKKGYKEGLVISNGNIKSGTGGGMCQLTNLIHWMVLHTSLAVTEHHHHDGIDLFPDFGRQVPFGVGTSILYNYLDYRFTNTTDATYQLVITVTEEYLCGEIRSDKALCVKYHIRSENEVFTREEEGAFRNNEIYRECVDKETGRLVFRELIKKNHAKVMYDESYLPPDFQNGCKNSCG